MVCPRMLAAARFDSFAGLVVPVNETVVVLDFATLLDHHGTRQGPPLWTQQKGSCGLHLPLASFSISASSSHLPLHTSLNLGTFLSSRFGMDHNKSATNSHLILSVPRDPPQEERRALRYGRDGSRRKGGYWPCK